VPYLSALEVRHDKALYKSTFTLPYLTDRQTPSKNIISLEEAKIETSVTTTTTTTIATTTTTTT